LQKSVQYLLSYQFLHLVCLLDKIHCTRRKIYFECGGIPAFLPLAYDTVN